MSKRSNETEDEHTSSNAKRTKIGGLSEPTKLNHADYTVAWICALLKEQTAAIAMLDRKHPDLLYPDKDDNVYTLGSIGGHNIVIACLPKGRHGTNSATTMVTQMISSFPSIKFGLLVGIGGGIPSKVRLGDVVVSAPNDQYPGVVQWDSGKAEDGGGFRRIGALNSPPNALLKILSKLESEHEMQESKIPTFLNEMKQKWPKLYPRYFWNDSLRDPQDNSSEGAANTATNIATNEPSMRCPDIHYGLIASGNQAIKDAAVRDHLDGDLDGDILCIEMEAAGLMNDFPCIVVRGICDYADSNSNKDWQEYAAAVAAAYAKEILSVLQIPAVERMNSIKDTLSSVNFDLGIIKTACNEIVSQQDTQDNQDLLDWLTPVDYTLQQKEYFSKRLPGTGQWLLSSDIYRSWVDTSQQTLFCPGIPGAGKTILTSVIVNDLFERFNKDTTVGIAYIYCNFRQHNEQKLHDLLKSLLKQLAYGQSRLPHIVKGAFNAFKGRTQFPSLDDTKMLFQHMAASYSRVFILIDALDECQGSDGCRDQLLGEIFRLLNSTKANILATSRFVPQITEKFKTCRCIEIRAIKEDVESYVHYQLETGNMEHLSSLANNKPALKNEIAKGISHAVDGMFLLAKIYLDTLADKVTIADIRDAVAHLPQPMARSGEDQKIEILNQAYESAWERINGQKEGFKSIARRVIAWITCAKRPLSTKELQHALAVKIGMDELDEDAIPQVHDMVSSCAGLVTVDEDSNIIRLVHYTAQEFFERKNSDYAEAMIAETCISYLSFRTFGEYCLDWPSLEYLRSHGFYRYASQYWGYHARLVGRKLDTIVLKFLISGTKASNAYCATLERYYLEPGSKFSLLNSLPQMSALHLAVQFGLDEALNALLKDGYDVNGAKGAKFTPLLAAIYKGHISTADLLLENGAHLGSEGGDSIHYLRAAMKTKSYNEEFVKRLIAMAIDLNEDISRHLLLAVQCGHEAIIELLLQKGANIETTDSFGCTPLHSCRSWTITKMLLDKGANIEATNTKGITPLHAAVLFKQGAIVKLLLEKGANIEASDEKGIKPLHIAAQNGAEEIFQLLLDKGANINAASQGGTPLHHAAFWNQKAIVQLLHKKGVNINTLAAGRSIRSPHRISQIAYI